MLSEVFTCVDIESIGHAIILFADMKFAVAALCASQVLAGGHEEEYGNNLDYGRELGYGHGLEYGQGHNREDFRVKGVFRGKGTVWRSHGWDPNKWEGKNDGKYEDKSDTKGLWDMKDTYGGLEWGKGLHLYNPDKYHWSNRFCQKVCDMTPGCRHDPQAHGSYCKFQGRDGRPAVCFGLYRIPKSLCRPHEHGIFSRKFCFEPFSRHCNDRRLQPVRCDREPKFDKWGAVVNLEIFLEADDV